ncbi:helix-turn-helix domain-containing protein [Aurantimonas coralicida]|uniref:helix-turn-helix domain-containing protein n=1 Tax=Aurantimonas coralicida TaxID=182270 RepID=UPI0039B6FBCE|nr:helix-turn-helix domain-containing protein [Aurantimonas coralicida]
MTEFSSTITRLRSSLGLKQTAMADRFGVDRSTLSRWESGVSRPRGAALKLLEAMLAEAAQSQARSEIVGRGGLGHDGETAAGGRSGHAISADAALRAEAGR